MKRPSSVSRQLVVEGYQDLGSVAELMGAHVNWPDDPQKAPVWIEIGRSASEILDEGYLTAWLKNSDLRALGVMLDADAEPNGRYQRIRQLCSTAFPQMPEELPRAGLIVTGEKRFGVWIMPDNSSNGYLETFLKDLVAEAQRPLWAHACESVDAARSLGANFRDPHIDKANLYTWLAWQDPPDQSARIALTKGFLDPRSDHAAAFIKWFRTLFEL